MIEREEILTGLKNAVDRGYSLQSAIQSFINAGYNAGEVQETAKQVNMGVIGQVSEQEQDKEIMQNYSNKEQSLEISPQPMEKINEKEKKITPSDNPRNYQPLPVQDMILKPKKRFPTFLIILIILFLLLVLGAVFFYFFGEAILNALFVK